MATTARYRFHSDPWINLHHMLYHWSREDLGLGRDRQAVHVSEREDMEELAEADRSAWESALELYREHVAGRGTFDDAMIDLKTALTRLGGDPSAAPPDVISGAARALSEAMPVYLERWWPEHDRRNRVWIGEMAALVEEHEDAFAALAEKSFGGEWPDASVRVDASAYASWAGAYTTNHPTHSVLAVTTGQLDGVRGLEIVFHETCHDVGLQAPLRRLIAEASGGRQVNPNLDHALIFYVSGWYARRLARRMGNPDFVPSAVEAGLTEFDSWQGLWEALEAEWPSVLEGRRGRLEAMRAVTASLPTRQGLLERASANRSLAGEDPGDPQLTDRDDGAEQGYAHGQEEQPAHHRNRGPASRQQPGRCCA